MLRRLQVPLVFREEVLVLFFKIFFVLFLMWTIFWLGGMWNLSSLTRDCEGES